MQSSAIDVHVNWEGNVDAIIAVAQDRLTGMHFLG